MSLLSKFIGSNPCKRASAMNHLQWAGIVSDNAVWPEDVADCDHQRAIDWLRAHAEWNEEHDFKNPQKALPI